MPSGWSKLWPDAVVLAVDVIQLRYKQRAGDATGDRVGSMAPWW